MEENNNQEYSKVPVKAGFWQSFKSFWLQPVVVELTPHQKKIFQEVHDFWTQEIHIENGNVVLRKPQPEIETEAEAITAEPEVNVSL